ncbi:MAG: hypothetical protein NC320_11285 [Clostridium sp.]|nr:hypothetical protein [Clostridium sp.]
MKKKVLSALCAGVMCACSILSQSICSAFSASEKVTDDYQIYLADYICESSVAQDYINRKYSLPYRTYVEDRRESTAYQAMLTAWEIATFDGKIIDGVAEKEVGYYETVLYDTICGGVNGIKELSDVSKIVKSTEAGTVSKMMEMSSKLEDVKLDDVLIGSDKMYEIIDIMSKLDGLKDAFKVIDKTSDILTKCNDAYEVIEKVSTLQVLLESQNESKQIIQDIANNTDNAALKKACENMIMMSDNTIPEAFTSAIFIAESSITDAVDEAYSELWDTVIEDLVGKGYGLAVKVGQKSGKLASNLLFSTDADVEHVYAMNALYEFEDELIDKVKKYQKEYKKNKTSENARLFNESYELLMKTYMEGADYSKRYAEITNEEGFMNKILKKYEAENHVKFMKLIDELKTNYKDYIKYMNSSVHDMWM